MGQLDFFWAASGFFFLFFLLLFFPPIMITMCEGWIWVRRQFIFVMDTRTGKLSAWILEGRKTDLINVILEPGGRTMAKRTGLLFPLLYFMAEFWLTSQQVLRIGKCYFFFPVFPLNKQTKKQKCSFCPFTVFGFTLAPFANALHNLDWTIMVFVFKGRTRSKKLMIYSGGCCFSFISSIKYWGRTNTTKLIYNVKCMEWHELNATMLNCVTTGEINK